MRLLGVGPDGRVSFIGEELRSVGNGPMGLGGYHADR